MQRSTQFRLGIATALAAGLIISTAGRVRAGDGPMHEATNLPSAGADTELRFVEPRTLLPVYPTQAILRTAQRTAPPVDLPAPPSPQPPQGSSLSLRQPGAAGQAEEIDAPWKPIGAVNARIAPPPGELPADLAAAPFVRQGEVHPQSAENRDWLLYSYNWEAAASSHWPLYFEEPNLERYGYTHGLLQPAISGIHFFGTIPLLPAKMLLEPPHTCEYDLGYAQPGDCAPRTRVNLLQSSAAH